MLRFTIRDLVWLMVVVALLLTLLPEIQRRHEIERMVEAMKHVEPTRRNATKADYDSLPFERANP